MYNPKGSRTALTGDDNDIGLPTHHTRIVRVIMYNPKGSRAALTADDNDKDFANPITTALFG